MHASTPLEALEMLTVQLAKECKHITRRRQQFSHDSRRCVAGILLRSCQTRHVLRGN